MIHAFYLQPRIFASRFDSYCRRHRLRSLDSGTFLNVLQCGTARRVGCACYVVEITSCDAETTACAPLPVAGAVSGDHLGGESHIFNSDGGPRVAHLRSGVVRSEHCGADFLRRKGHRNATACPCSQQLQPRCTTLKLCRRLQPNGMDVDSKVASSSWASDKLRSNLVSPGLLAQTQCLVGVQPAGVLWFRGPPV